MVILGIWDGHDSGAVLIRDGRLVAAINEERLTRRKLEICFPDRSIAACLTQAGVAAQAVDLVAVSTSDPAKTLARWLPRVKEDYYRTRRRRNPPGRFASFRKSAKYWITEWGPSAPSRRLSLIAIRRMIARLGMDRARVTLFDHHACHAAAAAEASGFTSCAVLTVDGVGDGLSSTVSVFASGQLRRVASSPARSSLGIFFEHVTNLLNMRELEDEGKVMALADYAAPVPDDRNPLLALLEVRNGELRSTVPGHAMMAHLRRIQWTYPNEQFAYMAQRVVEDVCVRLAMDAMAATGQRRLALAGGVVQNVKANRRVRLLPGLDDVFVFPHMGDGGLAAGAAIAAARAEGVAVGADWEDLGFGPAFCDQAIAASLARASLTATQPHDLAGVVADLLQRDRIVMWFQGPMEYGPRSLGHRSVLARPDCARVRDRLNRVLKQRVWYQPFCPSMLESEAPRVLEDYAGSPNRHMTMAYMVGPAFRTSMVGVTSVDGSCRPQMVPDAAPGLFPDLLRVMKATTGLGVVLNTSFNIHGEPLVCMPDEAVDVYLRSGADALAIGPYLCVRPSEDVPRH